MVLDGLRGLRSCWPRPPPTRRSVCAEPVPSPVHRDYATPACGQHLPYSNVQRSRCPVCMGGVCTGRGDGPRNTVAFRSQSRESLIDCRDDRARGQSDRADEMSAEEVAPVADRLEAAVKRPMAALSAEDRRFWIGVICALLRQPALIFGFTRSYNGAYDRSPLGDRSGSAD